VSIFLPSLPSRPLQCGSPPALVVFNTRIGPAYCLGSGFCVAVLVAFFPRVFFVFAIASPVLLGKAPAPVLALGEHVGLGFDVAGGGQKVDGVGHRLLLGSETSRQ
jgi:hypothetical protein